MSNKKRRSNIDSKRFIEVYMETDFNYQVSEKLNITLEAVSQKASHLRSSGVNLPYRFPRDDIDELNNIIKEIESRKSENGDKNRE